MSSQPSESNSHHIVCILGMHRAGTSMIAQLLGKCGVYLGREADLMPANVEDNPAGYWENQLFAEINNRILEHFGGSWGSPPSFPARWAADSSLAPIKEQALRLISFLNQNQIWGWKDPRTCLTLPFWQQLIPNLSYVISVRHPFSVAQSLATRRIGYIQKDPAIELWRRYYEAILPLLGDKRVVVSQYCSYFYDAARELERVLVSLGLKSQLQFVPEAVKRVEPANWRNVSLLELEADQPQLPPEVRNTYNALYSQSGPVFADMVQDKASHESLQSSALGKAGAKIERLESLYLERSLQIEGLNLLLFEACSALGTATRGSAGPISDLTAKIVEKAAQFEQAGELPTVELLLNCALLLSPNDETLWNRLGLVLMSQGRMSEAASIFAKCLKISRENATYRLHFAKALVGMGKIEEALQQFDAVLLIEPKNLRAHYDRACALLQAQRPLDAIEEFDRYVRIDPGSADTALQMGNAYLSLGRTDEAHKWFRRAVKFRPNWESAKSALQALSGDA